METTDYLRREIPYVNYVRDIRDAGVYIISTSQRTGSGGAEYTFFLVGQHEFAGMRDTISFVTTPDETTEGYRSKHSEDGFDALCGKNTPFKIYEYYFH
jgi:hypothetical protein